MATLVSSRYSLKSLHEEIGLLDRKLAHHHKYSVFSSDTEREAAAAKMEQKRNLLIRQARAMVDDGIQFRASDVPSSLRDSESVESVEETPLATASEAPLSSMKQIGVKPASPFAGTVLDGEQALQQYKQKKARRSAQLPSAVVPA